MSHLRNRRQTRLVTLGLLTACLIPMTGCIDLALIGMNAAIRDSQNKERIRQEQAIDAQRANRDYQLQEEIRRLRQQNDALMQSR